MAVKRVSRAFKDISLSFEPHPVTKDLPILKNERAIQRAVRNLVQTHFNERFFQPELGSPIGELLFEFVDFGSSTLIQEQVRDVIERFEPRVDNVVVNVRPLPDLNEFECVVAYDVVGLDVPAQEFTFILEATR
ncbi:baseplate wedge subunit [Synechococcus phage S-T4]|jgi:phage baseplate assembly protein W|uniref:Baseplate wedge subunit n=1 Tax=Synechococcus phage S-T4 TaxID=2268578 RepID=A0A385EHN4_9CAUD|nr:baseplate wedge subunit [Synechococcus phage S-T4]AXQ70598.1 baseplate wedge subunit [Synechococcus phage S-T4]